MSIEYDKTFEARVVKKDRISHDVYLFGFKSEQNVQLEPSEHIQITMKGSDGEPINRNYTPIISDRTYIEVPIKIYKTGALTPLLEKIPLHSTLSMQKKIGKLAYQGLGRFVISPKVNKQFKVFSTLLLVCGGTGITPAYSLINHLCKQQQDPLKIHLLYANKTLDDILLKPQLDMLQANFSNKFQYTNILDKEPNYTGLKGFVTLEAMRTVFPNTPSEETLGGHCGPGAMNKIVAQLFSDFGLNYVVKF